VLVIGENINASIKEVEEAIQKRDAEFIQDLARRQQEGGADYLEVNSGLRLYPEEEAEDLEWLVGMVQAATGLPVCLDSTYAKVHQAALRHHQGKAIINSINGDPAPWGEILPLAKEYGSSLVGLLSDRKGIPDTAAGRLKIAEKIIQGVKEAGLPEENLFLDPVVMPISVNTKNGLIFLETLREIKKSFPGVKTVSALSNISYGLPRRRLINQAFLTLALGAGLDAAIINPLDWQLMALKLATEALKNQDSFCLNYIKAYRAGRLTAPKT
jgi:cobalamin-dependent methionine synthase I